MDWTGTTCLAGALVLLATSAAAAPPPPPPTLAVDATRSVAVSFVIDEIDLESGERIAAGIAEQLRLALTEADYHVVEDPQFAEHHLHVEIMLTDAIARDYEIAIESDTKGAGPELRMVVGPTICHACTEAVVVEFVMAERAQILAELEARMPDEPADPVPAVHVDPDPPSSSARPKPRRLAHAGITMLSLGVLTAVAGGSLWGVGEYEDVRPGDQTYQYFDFRPAGIAMTAAGALATITGVSLLAVDFSRRRRQPGKLSFHTTPGYAGLHFQARF